MKKYLILLFSLISVFGYTQTLHPNSGTTALSVNNANTLPTTVSGTNTYTATLPSAGTITDATNFFTDITDRLIYYKFTNAATSAPFTLNLNSEGAKDLKKRDATGSIVDIVATDIAAGQVLPIRYNGTYLVIEGGSGSGGGGITDLTGDVTASGTGSVVATIASGVIVNADVNASAAISGSKLDMSSATAIPVSAMTSLNGSRTLAVSGATLQSDNLNIVYFNSASPVNFTIDQLTIGSQVVVINKGAGLVSFVNGTGVTYTGAVSAAQNESVLILYETSTAPQIRSSSGVDASPTVKGVAKLYTSTGVGADGAMSQSATTTALATKESLSGTNTLTGVRSLISNAPIQETVNGTFTTALNNQWHTQRASTITLGNTTGWDAYDLDFSNTFVRTNTGQSAASIRINPTFTGAFTSALSILFGSSTSSTNAAYIYNVTGETGFLTNSNGNLVFGGGGKRMTLGKAGNIELTNTGTTSEPTFSFTVNQSPTFSTTAGGGGIYSKQSVGHATPATNGNFYGMYNAGTVLSNWVNSANFYGNAVANDFSPTGSSSTYVAFAGNYVVNASGGTNKTYGFLNNPTKTSMTGISEYSFVSTSTTASGGTGILTPHSSWQVNGSFAAGYVAKSANYTATFNDYTIDCTANTFQVTLPTAVGIAGRLYVITNSGAGTITIGTTSSQTFANVTATPTTLTMSTVGARTVQSNGANWILISSL